MTVDAPGLAAAARALVDPAGVASAAESAVRQAGAAARRSVRRAAPRARGLPPGSRYASGRPRRPGDLARAVSLRSAGAGFDAASTVRAGGMANLVTKGAPPHEIAPRKAKALSLPMSAAVAGPSRKMTGALAVARVRHPGFAGRPFVSPGLEAARPEIARIIGETGQRVVASLGVGR